MKAILLRTYLCYYTHKDFNIKEHFLFNIYKESSIEGSNII